NQDLGGKFPNSKISNSAFGNGAPFPSLVSTRANGTYSMNYRNEPVQLRVDPDKNLPAQPKQTDLAYAFSSVIDRAHDYLNKQPKGNDPISGACPEDPYRFP